MSKREQGIHIVLHGPSSAAGEADLARRVAAAHARGAISVIAKSQLSPARKKELARHLQREGN